MKIKKLRSKNQTLIATFNTPSPCLPGDPNEDMFGSEKRVTRFIRVRLVLHYVPAVSTGSILRDFPLINC